MNAPSCITGQNEGVRAMREEWRPWPGYEGRYEVSNLGRARSIPRRGVRGGILKPMLNTDGYAYIGLRRDGVRRMLRLHRIVAEVFVPGGKNALHTEVAHLDNDRANPRADNLKWVSKVENRSHRKLHGTECCGERHGAAKLTEAAVVEIRSFAKYRVDQEGLARKFGVSPRTIDSVRRGKNWRHVTAPFTSGAVPHEDEADAPTPPSNQGSVSK